jgi:hypothetical protein
MLDILMMIFPKDISSMQKNGFQKNLKNFLGIVAAKECLKNLTEQWSQAERQRRGGFSSYMPRMEPDVISG